MTTKEENTQAGKIMQNNIRRFESELGTISRPGMEKLMEYIQKNSDFYTAPASTRYHLSVPGGLLQHSLNVLDALRGLLTKGDDGLWEYRVAGKCVEKVSDDNVIVMALLHDLCKTKFYVESTRNRKTKDGKWEPYRYYEIEDEMPLGHGEKSVMLLQYYIPLERIEVYAIRWHMGMPEGTDTLTFNSAVQKHPIIWAMHSADLMAAQFMEDKENVKEAFRSRQPCFPEEGADDNP